MFRTLVILLLATGCTKVSPGPQNSDEQKTASADQLKARGQQIYMSNCTSCHNSNPKLPGSVGPDLAGSSADLIKARVGSATYPPGYKPKRQTAAMPAFPALAKEADALAAYLGSIQ